MSYSSSSLNMMNFPLSCDFYLDITHTHTQRSSAYLPKTSSIAFPSVGACSAFLLSVSLSPFLPGTGHTPASHVTTHLYYYVVPVCARHYYKSNVYMHTHTHIHTPIQFSQQSQEVVLFLPLFDTYGN